MDTTEHCSGRKVCKACGRALPATKEFFNRIPRRGRGLADTCKDCRRPDNQHRWRTANGNGAVTHGLTRTPAYRSWHAMKSRCLNPYAKEYSSYGGRGITVCAEWRGSFEAFLRDMGERPAGTTLERLDVNGHYEPGNVVWATSKAQGRNKRGTHYLTIDDQTKPLATWAEDAELSYFTLLSRVQSGRPLDRAILCPPITRSVTVRARNAMTVAAHYALARGDVLLSDIQGATVVELVICALRGCAGLHLREIVAAISAQGRAVTAEAVRAAIKHEMKFERLFQRIGPNTFALHLECP